MSVKIAEKQVILCVDECVRYKPAAWAPGEAKQFEAYQRELADIENQFQKPFARNFAQNFPVDAPFYTVLPNLSEPFDSGDIQLVSPSETFTGAP